MQESAQLCTSPTPLPRVPINYGGGGQLTVPLPLPRRPTTQNALLNNSPRVRASLPVPLSRSPFNSPVRANSLPHAPKLPPRKRKPKSVEPHKSQLVLNKHATRHHNQLLPKSSNLTQKNNTLPHKNAQISSNNSEKTQNTQDTQTNNLTNDEIQIISEREREMFDYHATSPGKLPDNSKHGSKNSKKSENTKNSKNTENNVEFLETEKLSCETSQVTVKPPIVTSEHTTMEQIYCQNCHMLLEKVAKTQENERVSPNCCGWFILLRKFLSKKWRISRRNSRYSMRIDDRMCKEISSTSFTDEFCVCQELEGKLEG